LLGVAANNIRLGKEAEAVPMLEEALRILEEIPNRASSINTNGELALAHLRLGARDKALEYAGRVLDLSEGISPTVYSLDMGFSAVAEVFLDSWGKEMGKPEARVFESQAERAIKLLQAFEKVFPIGRAYTAYYRGRREWLLGNQHAALKHWRKGLQAARKFRVRYEEGLLCLMLAQHSTDDSDARRENIRRAVEIFETMGAARELEAARSIAAGI
jgi:tetratricopeptide (TPR) repeat protein